MDKSQQPELRFAQEGDDLVVAGMVIANNSPHVLWTRVHIVRAKVIPTGGTVDDAKEEHRVSLYYYVFQNRDLYTRSFKDVEITWRLRGHKKGSETYCVVEKFDPDAAELERLLPKLKSLADGNDCP